MTKIAQCKIQDYYHTICHTYNQTFNHNVWSSSSSERVRLLRGTIKAKVIFISGLQFCLSTMCERLTHLDIIGARLKTPLKSLSIKVPWCSRGSLNGPPWWQAMQGSRTVALVTVAEITDGSGIAWSVMESRHLITNSITTY